MTNQNSKPGFSSIIGHPASTAAWVTALEAERIRYPSYNASILDCKFQPGGSVFQSADLGGSVFREAKPMVGTNVHSPIGLLRKRAATQVM